MVDWSVMTSKAGVSHAFDQRTLAKESSMGLILGSTVKLHGCLFIVFTIPVCQR